MSRVTDIGRRQETDNLVVDRHGGAAHLTPVRAKLVGFRVVTGVLKVTLTLFVFVRGVEEGRKSSILVNQTCHVECHPTHRPIGFVDKIGR